MASERQSGNEKSEKKRLIPNQVRSYLYDVYSYIVVTTAASEVLQQQAPHLYLLQVKRSTLYGTRPFVVQNTYCHSYKIFGF
jgi:hypothetical protein